MICGPITPNINFPICPLIEGNEVIGYNTEQSGLTTNYTNRAVDFIRTGSTGKNLLDLAHSMPRPLAVSDNQGEKRAGTLWNVMMELDWSVESHAGIA